MATLHQINYDDMQTFIKQLQAEEEEIKVLFNQTKSKVETLHGNQWVGVAADRFFSEMEGQVLPRTARMISALNVAGNVAKQITEIIHQSDEETKGFFSGLGA